MARGRFGAAGFAMRWVVAIVLVFATYNPTPYNYVAWVTQDAGGWPLKVLVGIALLILYGIYVQATFRSIGIIGLVIVLLFFAALLWALDSWNIVDLGSQTTVVWVVLIVVATILAIGVSWSHVHRRITGQVDVDEPDIP